MSIEATVTVMIDHVAGPVVQDADHIRAWIVADGAWINGVVNGFTYEVCPLHADPEECSCDGEVALYRAMFASVDRGDG